MKSIIPVLIRLNGNALISEKSITYDRPGYPDQIEQLEFENIFVQTKYHGQVHISTLIKALERMEGLA